MKNRVLYNQVEIPPVIMGTYPLTGEAMTTAVDAALAAGYRGFDTAYNYRNEDSLGNALAELLPKHGLKRDDVFLETKLGEDLNHGIPDGNLLTRHEGEDKDIAALVDSYIESSCRKLRTDYLDLLMIHWPHPDYFVDIWRELERVYHQGRARAIGVSNCREWHLRKLIESGAEHLPMVNQIEHRVLNSQRGIVEICHQLSIQLEAYSPLMRAPKNSDTLTRIAEAHEKSTAQVILRWNIQHGIIPLPKSAHPERLRENIDIFDFELSPDEMTAIDLLNTDSVYLDPETYCPGFSRFKES